MSRISRSTLLIGTAILALAACSSTKGPGELGTKDDIVVRNHGMPQAKQAEAPAPQTGDFTSTVEQGEAIPAPEVPVAEPLPDSSPAVEQAVEAQAQATAPLPPAAAPDMADPADAVIPAEPVAQAVTPPAPEDYATTAPAQPDMVPPMPESAPSTTSSGVYPATDYPVPQTAQAAAPPVPAPVAQAPAIPAPAPLPEGVKYPLDPDAPYSPKAVEAAIAAAGASVPESASATVPTGNPSDPATIRAAQAALKARGLFTDAETGTMDAAMLNALIMYQAQMGLPQGGLNDATLRSLGVVQ